MVNLQDFADDFSDVILYEAGTFKNFMTDKEDKNLRKVVRKKRFIVFSDDDISGYFAAEKDGLLYLFLASFNTEKRQWIERKRIIFHKNKTEGDINIGYDTDIGGQNTYADEDDINNESFVSKKNAQEYFGKAITISRKSVSHNIFPRTFGCIEDFELMLMALNGVAYDNRRNKGCFIVHAKNGVFGDIGGHTFMKNKFDYGPEDWEIPEKAKSVIAKMEKSIINYLCAPFQAEELDHIFAILQLWEGRLIERRFVFMEWEERSGKKLEVVEFNRLPVDSDMSPFKREIIYVDDLSGTRYAYSAHVVESIAKLADKFNTESYEDAVDDINDAFMDVYYCKCDYATILMNALSYQWFEKVIKIASPTVKEYLYDNVTIFLSCCCLPTNGYDKSMSDFMEKYFGYLDYDAKTLDGFLCAPKGFVKKCLESSKTYWVIPMVKQVFDEDKQYFKRMNQEDWQVIFECFHKNKKNRLNTKKMVEAINVLSHFYGCKNVVAYFKFISSMDIPDMYEYSVFTDNLHIAMRNKIQVPKDSMPWKMKKDDFLKNAAMLEMLIDINRNYDEILEKFNAYQDEWSGYAFDDCNYLITWPKKPEDIVEEGLRLKHCAKTFVNMVADGETTLLFLREKDIPEKPFFTVEVRDGEIRQAHGFGNSCVTGKGLCDFLERFAKAKDIRFSKKDSARMLEAE